MRRFCLAIFFAGAMHAAVAPASTEAEALFVSGKRALQQREYSVAVERLGQAVALAPHASDYYHWLGNGYAWAAAVAPLCDKSALGKKCLAAYQRAIELDPDNLAARLSLVNFYRHVPRLLGGGVTRARVEAEEICRRDPTKGAYALAVLHWHEKNYAAAFATLGDVLRQQPDHYAANFLFGRVALASRERVPEGEAAFRRCLRLTPSDYDESHESVTRWLGQLSPPGEAVVQ